MLVQCCVCKKIERDGNTWEDASEHYHDASHTYCPTCAKAAWADVEAYRHTYTSASARRARLGSLQDLFQPRKPLTRLQSDSTF